MTQIPPDKKFLPGFAWFDYVRPLNKDDIFNWRGKKAGTELKIIKRKEAPLQHLSSANDNADTPAATKEETATKAEATTTESKADTPATTKEDEGK